jgi:hypothetical protein
MLTLLIIAMVLDYIVRDNEIASFSSIIDETAKSSKLNSIGLACLPLESVHKTRPNGFANEPKPSAKNIQTSLTS